MAREETPAPVSAGNEAANEAGRMAIKAPIEVEPATAAKKTTRKTAAAAEEVNGG